MVAIRQPSADHQLKVAFIASVGYSGSTLLELLLGNHPEIASLGEVYILAKYVRTGAQCTCGLPTNGCPFWMAVENELKATNPRASLAQLPLTVEEPIAKGSRKLPTINDLALLSGSKSLWKQLANVNSLVNQYTDCAENMAQIFRAVSNVTGKRIIVDSSKYAIPMKISYLTYGARSRILFLVRDGRATSLSLVQRKSIDFDSAARYWKRYVWNLRAMMATIPRKQVMLVKYEELCARPHDVVAEIEAFLGCADHLSSLELRKSASHSIGGNPMRMRRDETEIVPRSSWRENITDDQLRVFESIAGETNRSFGYG